MNLYYIIKTDAFNIAIDAMLQQLQGDLLEECVMTYFSRKLIGVETRYLTYNRELLAIKDAIEH